MRPCYLIGMPITNLMQSIRGGRDLFVDEARREKSRRTQKTVRNVISPLPNMVRPIRPTLMMLLSLAKWLDPTGWRANNRRRLRA